MKNRGLILASGSYWRRELLSWLGVPFEVVESGFDERSVEEGDPVRLVEILAKEKALVVAERELVKRGQEGVVVGADTVVVVDGENVGDIKLLGKPKDINHAREMLEHLRGNEQRVVTGVCVVKAGRVAQTEKVVLGVDVSRVRFRNFSDKELEDYLATGESMGKAGAFGILGKAMGLIEEVEGSISGVIGLPLLMSERLLGKVGLEVVVAVEEVAKERLVEEFEKSNPEARLRVED